MMVKELQFSVLTHGAKPSLRSVLAPIAPPRSFIAFDDYAGGPAQMAAHLKSLIANATAYAEFFRW